MNNGYKVWRDPFLRMLVLEKNRPLKNRFSAFRAVELNYLEFFKYTVSPVEYYKNVRGRLTTKAAELGHLEILRWLHTHNRHCNEEWMYNVAIAGGHVHVLKWIHDELKFPLHAISYYLERAGTLGHLEALQYVFNHHDIPHTYVLVRILRAAAIYYQNDVVEWFLRKFTFTYGSIFGIMEDVQLRNSEVYRMLDAELQKIKALS